MAEAVEIDLAARSLPPPRPSTRADGCVDVDRVVRRSVHDLAILLGER